jgi:hypothetical protein
MPKKQKNKKSEILPYIKKIKIYGIFSVEKKTLIKVDISEENIWFEFDTNMFDDEKYKVVTLEISL